MIDWCNEALNAWQYSVLNQISRSTHYISDLPDAAVFEEVNRLVVFLWRHKIYLEKCLIEVFIYFARKCQMVKHLKIPEECISILNRMVLIRWDRYFKECSTRCVYYKPHSSDKTFPNFMAVEKLKIKEKYVDEEIAERIYYALYPCSIPNYAHVHSDTATDCTSSAEHRCSECSQLYCSDHHHSCTDYAYQCQSCKIRIPLADKYTSRNMCKCGFSKICKELLAEL